MPLSADLETAVRIPGIHAFFKCRRRLAIGPGTQPQPTNNSRQFLRHGTFSVRRQRCKPRDDLFLSEPVTIVSGFLL